MKAFDLYVDLLTELDKYGSPSFSTEDFSYFANSSLSAYIADNYRRLDILQKDSDDLRFCIELDKPLSLDISGKGTLPTDYRHLLGMKVKVKFKEDVGVYRKDATETFTVVKRSKSSQKGVNMRNPYKRPSYRTYFYEMHNAGINVLFDSTKTEFQAGDNAWIDYIKSTSAIYLAPPGEDYNLEAKNTTLAFCTGAERNHVYFEIVMKCRQTVLENIESYPRFSVASQQLTTT